jgi:hypothetical protein
MVKFSFIYILSHLSPPLDYFFNFQPKPRKLMKIQYFLHLQVFDIENKENLIKNIYNF